MIDKIWNFLNKDKPNNLWLIIVATVPSILSFILSLWIQDKKIDKLQANMNQKIDNKISFRQTFNDTSTKVLGTQIKKTDTDENNKWELSSQIMVDDKGYSCPKSISFPSWLMWTDRKYKADEDFKITFSLEDRTDDNKNPTFYISYGDKTGSVPETFYKINLLDGDLNTMRLYNQNMDPINFGRTENPIDLHNFITLSISPSFPDKQASQLILNPLISYQLDGKKKTYDSERIFKVNLPISSPDEQGEGFQYGVGVSKGDCIKIIK